TCPLLPYTTLFRSGVLDDATAASARGRRRALPFRRRRDVRPHGRAGRVPRVGRGARSRQVRHAARTGRGRPGAGPFGAARDRPAGCTPGPQVLTERVVRVPGSAELGRAGPPARGPWNRVRSRARTPAAHRS